MSENVDFKGRGRSDSQEEQPEKMKEDRREAQHTLQDGEANEVR